MNGLLLLAVATIGAAVFALLTDTLMMRGTFKKSDHPTLFKFGVAFYFLAGIISLILYFQSS